MQSQPDLIQPAAEIAFPNSTLVQAAFGRDSGTLIVQTSENAINLFGLAVYFWPEILGGLTFLLVALALLRWWRAAHTPRLAGQPHCRRCGYCLTGLTLDRCPECGTPPSKRRPIIGRSLKRRVGPLLAVASVASLAYGSLWAFQVPRVGYVNRLISIWSPETYEAARQRNATFLDRIILKHGGPVIRLSEYNAATGKERRVIARLRGAAFDDTFALNDARDRIWITSHGKTRLNVISAGNGSILRTFSIPPGLKSAAQWQEVAGILPAGTIAIAVIHESPADPLIILSADSISGDLRRLFEVDLAQSDQPSQPRPFHGGFSLVPGGGPIRLVEARDASKPTGPNSWSVRSRIFLHDFADGRWSSREFPRCFSSYDAPAFSPDGRFMFLPTTFAGETPVRWNLESLDPVGYERSSLDGEFEHWSRLRRDPPIARGSARVQFGPILAGRFAYDAVGNRFYSVLHGRPDLKLRLAVYSEESEQWRNIGAYPYDVIPLSLAISCDGRRLVVNAIVFSPGAPLQSRLLLYDLP